MDKSQANNIRIDKTKLKTLVMKLESKNYDRLIFYQSDNDYYKLAGHSALIYAGNIAKRIGRRFNLRADTDHYSKSVDGVISIVMNDRLRENLSVIKATIDSSNKNPHLIIFRLPYKFSEQDIEQFREWIKQEERQINQIILPKSPIPTLYTYVNELTEMIYHNSKNMSHFGGATLGTDIFNSICSMHRCYLNYANGFIKLDNMASTMKKNIIYLKNEMKIIETLHLINNKNICKILEILVATERLVTKYAKQS